MSPQHPLAAATSKPTLAVDYPKEKPIGRWVTGPDGKVRAEFSPDLSEADAKRYQEAAAAAGLEVVP